MDVGWHVLDLPGVGDAAVAYMPGSEIEPSGGIEEITDPMEAYLRQRMAQKKVAALQAEIDGLARITEVMKKAAQEAAERAAEREDDDRDFEKAAGR